MLAKFEELLLGHTDLFPEVAEVAVDHLGREDVVTGRHGRVAREDGIRPNPAGCFIACEAFKRMLAQALQQVERGMPLVGVPVVRLDAERAQRAYAADPKDDLLPEPVLEITTVEPRRNRPRPLGVAVDIGSSR